MSLQPGAGGVFVITYDGEVIWERKTDGGFPDVKQLKQRVRDRGWTPAVTSAILTGSLLTKVTGRHDRFHYAGSPSAGSADVEARLGPKLPPNRSKRRIAMKTSCASCARRARATAT